jgi:hypothetical protein
MPARLAAVMAMAAVNEGFIRISPRLGTISHPPNDLSAMTFPARAGGGPSKLGSAVARNITLRRLPRASRPTISALATPLGIEPQRAFGEIVGCAAKTERRAQLEFADRHPRFSISRRDMVGSAPHGSFQERLDA